MILFACMNFSIGWEGLLILGVYALAWLILPFVACAAFAAALKGLFAGGYLLVGWIRGLELGKDRRLREYEAQYAAWEAERARLAEAWEREQSAQPA